MKHHNTTFANKLLLLAVATCIIDHRHGWIVIHYFALTAGSAFKRRGNSNAASFFGLRTKQTTQLRTATPRKKPREIAIPAAQKQRMGNLGRNAAHEKHYKFRATVREKSVAK
ncbi:hypothetical protein [Burkholderia multivorans]|uniref:hypothetical protein n=1 Tax=Burkholderia multivorans TaxID=87883 RepID=UPI0012D9E3E7|nr:hypothetical protein [Burkholderia multivorans]MBU9651102.1 hypothetical protein [Burkholderia multivorans]MDN8103994.1 hypothetical protein [Burkholderia multivorans]